MSDQELRIGDAEREQAATDLGEHCAQGRITTEERELVAERHVRPCSARPVDDRRSSMPSLLATTHSVVATAPRGRLVGPRAAA